VLQVTKTVISEILNGQTTRIENAYMSNPHQEPGCLISVVVMFEP
jgi:hypothetical protein